MSALIAAALAYASGAGLAGCGAGSPAHRVHAHGASSRRVEGPSRALASRLLASAASALDQVRSFHIQAQWFYDDEVPRTLSGEFSLPGRFTASILSGGETLKLVVIDNTAYVRGNSLYWANYITAASIVRAVSNRWVRLPADAVPGLGAFQALADPKTAGRCALESGTGPVDGGQREELNGREPALAVQIEGARPGIPIGTVMLAASGPPLPIVITQIAPAQPTGPLDPACGQPQTPAPPVRSSMMWFSRYDVPTRISPPAGSIGGRTLTAALLAGAAASASTDVVQRARQQRELLGSWSATARVIESRNFANEPPGLTFQRLWQISRRCAAGSCRMYMIRATDTGPESTWLGWAADHWTAQFITTIPCTDGTASSESEDFTLRVRPGTIDAVEHDRTTGSCPTSTGLVRWIAHPGAVPGGPKRS